MKWPELMLLIRHDVSSYNELKEKKARSDLYRRFLSEFEKNSNSRVTRALALEVQEKFALNVSDAETPLLDKEAKRAEEVGIAPRKKYAEKIPDVIFVSPYLRTKLTLAGLVRGWKELGELRVIEDERIREQEHGLALLYNDWRVFHSLHPEQGLLYKVEGPYYYRYPQGESVPDVRERNRSWITTVVRDFAEMRVLAVTHHLNILGVRAHLERWNAKHFMEVDEKDKPTNCSVTAYTGNPDKGSDGKFELVYYNRSFYKSSE